MGVFCVSEIGEVGLGGTSVLCRGVPDAALVAYVVMLNLLAGWSGVLRSFKACRKSDSILSTRLGPPLLKGLSSIKDGSAFLLTDPFVGML